ncbi:alginate O-acetyltransferase [Pseudomonas sp. UL073]|uniref:Probable alginate O-acetylase AlgJ n=1 Tax=Zestomonas insulae TaxID=2809017 RepID=A0ABS2IA79_9GAMM|nr:alginate O-acetyltransferase [Pseudomonas insulae]MBM7060046.1 alginate O-acetyltransferase [Pseudomonas insulae]
MTRSLRILYISLFLALIFGLGAWSVRGFFGYSVPPDTQVLNGKLAKALETRYDAEFPLKRLATNLWAAMDYTLFKEGRPGVELGRHNWLFSDEELDPVAKGEQHVENNLRLVEGVRQSLARHDIKLLLAIVPSKARLYPEHLGEVQPASLRRDLYQRFHVQVRRAGIVAPDLLASLERAKGNGALYLRTDTHWTPHGAEVVAQRIGLAVQRRMPLEGERQRFVTDFGATAPYKGDLTSFLPLDPLFSDLLPPPDRLQQRTTRALDAEQAASGDALFADDQVPVVLVGTSYSANPKWNFQGALRQALGTDLVSFAEEGQGPLQPMLKYLQSDELKNSPPQLVIWEFPERYLPMAADLSQFDPEWVAQLKASAAAGERLADTATR